MQSEHSIFIKIPEINFDKKKYNYLYFLYNQLKLKLCAEEGMILLQLLLLQPKLNPYPPVINDGKKTSDPGNDSDFVTLVTTDSNVIIWHWRRYFFN
ncbi:MAG: hypothetical protein IPL20_11090 [Saprospiraceae bacterium]|nr:hypothetical protein [Saprospiraceae bacterium]